jgi:hypothetical protein
MPSSLSDPWDQDAIDVQRARADWDRVKELADRLAPDLGAGELRRLAGGLLRHLEFAMDRIQDPEQRARDQAYDQQKLMATWPEPAGLDWLLFDGQRAIEAFVLCRKIAGFNGRSDQYEFSLGVASGRRELIGLRDSLRWRRGTEPIPRDIMAAALKLAGIGDARELTNRVKVTA